MNTDYFTYSILCYKHSITLGESLNVAILFYFPEVKQFIFANGDSTRAKAIYPDFNTPSYNAFFKAIDIKLKKHVDLFSGQLSGNDFANYIHNNILAEDAAGLIFCEPVTVKNVFRDIDTAINEYSKLLLPGINVEKPNIEKHNDSYIINTFTNYILQQNIDLEDKFIKDEIIKTKHFNIKFDLSWHNSTQNYIKPISFDFLNESFIQTKAATFYGYISDLQSVNKSSKLSFDFLIGKPQKSSLLPAYENALDFLDSAKGQKRLIIEDQIDEYSQEVISNLILN